MPKLHRCRRWSLEWVRNFIPYHYNDVIMDAIASQITSLTIVYSTVYSDADERNHQSSASQAFVWGIHRWPVNSPHKWPVTQKMFPFDDVFIYVYQHMLVLNQSLLVKLRRHPIGTKHWLYDVHLRKITLTPRFSDPVMPHDTCVTHMPWCMPGSLTIGFLWSRWRERRSRHSRRMHNPQFYVSGKRPIASIVILCVVDKRRSLLAGTNIRLYQSLIS